MADNLLDKASILLTPTAYNDGSMLSVKPENGDGDFTFSRSSAATRVNAQGLVENVQIISSELVSNGNFSQIGTEEVSNGNFSQEGSELVTNGDFATDSDWDKDANWSIANGIATSTGVGRMYQSIPFLESNVGTTVKVSFDITNNSNGGVVVNCYGGISQLFTGVGTHTFTTTTTDSSNLYFNNAGAGANFNGSIDNVSVKEVGQDWNLDSGWSIGDDKAINDGTSGFLIQSNILTIGKTYKITYTLLNVASGKLRFRDAGVNGTPKTSNGTYTDYITVASTRIAFQAYDGFNGSITNISVKEVGQDWTFDEWTLHDDNGDLKAKFTGSTSGQYLKQENVYTPNSKIKLQFNVSNLTSGALKIISTGVVWSTPVITTNGTFTYIIDTTGTSNGHIYFRANGGSFDGYVDNISVKEITDDTDLPRINYEGFSYQDALGSEQVVNGTFDNGSANWTVAGGNPIFENSSVNFVNFSTINSNNIVVELGKTYKITYTISNKVGNSSFGFFLGGWNVAQYQDVGTHSEIISVSSSSVIYIRNGDSNSSLTIDNVSIKEVLGQEVVPDSGCGSWLLEPQSTNLIPYSEDFSQWSAINSNNTIITDINPIDNLAYKIESSVTGSSSRIYQDSLMTAGNDYASSYLVKSSANSPEYIGFSCISNTEPDVLYNFSTNSFEDFNIVGNAAKCESISMTNGWKLLKVPVHENVNNTRFNIYQGSRTGNILLGTSGEFYYLKFAQLEQQSYATSYIPTNGATSTRLQDIATNSGNSTLINSTEGVLYAEIAALANDGNNRAISINNGSFTDYLFFRYRSNNQFQIILRANNNNVVNEAFNLSNNLDFNKIAFSYKLNEFKIFVNGLQIGSTITSGNVFGTTINSLDFDEFNGTNKFYGKVKCVAVYKEALTDAQLQSLTTQ